MEKRDVVVRCESGLHNKQAAFFVQKATEFDSDIWVEYENARLNGKSLMGIMCMGIVTGARIGLCAEGPDAAKALNALEQLLQRDVPEFQ